MISEVKNKKQIANIIDKKMNKDSYNIVAISKKCDISRNSVYKIRQEGGQTQGYNIDILMKICNELGIKIYLEF